MRGWNPRKCGQMCARKPVPTAGFGRGIRAQENCATARAPLDDGKYADLRAVAGVKFTRARFAWAQAPDLTGFSLESRTSRGALTMNRK